MAENGIEIYQTEDGQTQIDVRLENDTAWLSQAQMVELFQKTPQNITMHIRNAFKDGGLDKKQLVRNSYKFKPKASAVQVHQCYE